MSALPNDLALTTIADDSEIVASDHRNNYSAIQAAVNALRDALADGTVHEVVTVVDGTHVTLGLIVDANIDAAAAIALSKLAAGTNHTLLLSGASTVGSLAAGSSGQVLISGGGSADPSWEDLTAANVAHAADKSSASPQVFTAPLRTPIVLRSQMFTVNSDLSPAPDASLGSWQIWNVNNQAGTTKTLNIPAPTNPPDSTHSQELTIALKTNHGSNSINFTWDTATGIYKTDGFTLPSAAVAPDFTCYARFRWDGLAWICIGVTSSGYGGGNG